MRALAGQHGKRRLEALVQAQPGTLPAQRLPRSCSSPSRLCIGAAMQLAAGSRARRQRRVSSNNITRWAPQPPVCRQLRAVAPLGAPAGMRRTWAQRRVALRQTRSCLAGRASAATGAWGCTAVSLAPVNKRLLPPARRPTWLLSWALRAVARRRAAMAGATTTAGACRALVLACQDSSQPMAAPATPKRRRHPSHSSCCREWCRSAGTMCLLTCVKLRLRQRTCSGSARPTLAATTLAWSRWQSARA